MSASLVGSEMCIRDSSLARRALPSPSRLSCRGPGLPPLGPELPRAAEAVSYTHLTLPTICSV
eukprot:11872117-Alexandrium_andersonii.AAC.1